MAKPNSPLNNVSAALRNQAAAEPRFTSIDQRLGGLGASISDALDDLAEGGEGEPGATGPDATTTETEPREAPAATPPDAPAGEGEGEGEPAAAAAASAVAAPLGDPFRVKAKPDPLAAAPVAAPTTAATAAPATPAATSTATTEPPSSSGVDPAVTAALAVLDSDVIDAIKKYTKIEDIKTADDLRAATKLVGRAYWDSTRALSERARTGDSSTASTAAPTDPAAAAPVAAPAAPTDPALIHYNTKIQSALKDGKKASDEIDAWKAIEVQKLGELETLKRKRASGESFDDSALTKVYEEIHDAQTQQAIWNRNWSTAQASWQESTVNRDTRAESLAQAARATRQEQEATQRDAAKAAEEFTNLIATRVTEYSKQYFVPEKHLPFLKKTMQGLLVQERLANGPFTQETLAAFVENQVKEYGAEHGFTQTQQKQEYSADKSGDAPKPVPSQKKVPGQVRQSPPPSRPANAPAPSLRHLEQQIMEADIDG